MQDITFSVDLPAIVSFWLDVKAKRNARRVIDPDLGKPWWVKLIRQTLRMIFRGPIVY